MERFDYDSATELFEEELFPEALVLGMPPELFWYGKPSWFLSYIEAYMIRNERDEEKNASLMDYQSWLTGLYVHQGVQVALSNSFAKNSHAKYLKEPMSFSQLKENKKLSESEEQVKLEREYLGFKLLTDAMNRKQ